MPVIYDVKERDAIVDESVEALYAKARDLDSRRQGEERFSASYVAGYLSWTVQKAIERAYEDGLLHGVAAIGELVDTGNDIEPGDDEGSLAFCFGMAL